MAEKKKETQDESVSEGGRIEYDIPMDWQYPENLVTRYANQMVVVSQEHECVISFFESKPPLLMAKTLEELNEKVKSVKSLPAVCVARIIVAKERMPAFTKAFATHAERAKREVDDNESNKEQKHDS